MKHLFLALLILIVSSCTVEDANEQSIDNTTQAEELKISYKSTGCGFGIFSNQEYDCGFKRGYGDWVYHYNTTVRNYEYDPCDEIRIIQNGQTVGIAAGKTDATSHIIQITQNNNQGYYNDLFNDLSTDYLKGKADGYSFGRGQEPITASDNYQCFNQLGGF